MLLLAWLVSLSNLLRMKCDVMIVHFNKRRLAALRLAFICFICVCACVSVSLCVCESQACSLSLVLSR